MFGYPHYMDMSKDELMKTWKPSEGTDDSVIIAFIKELPSKQLEKLRRGEKTEFLEKRKADGTLLTEEFSDVWLVYEKIISTIAYEFGLLKKIKQSDCWCNYGYMAKYYIHTNFSESLNLIEK